MKKITILILLGSCIFYFGLAQENEDYFNIYFKHDFENNTTGAYDVDEWDKDWSPHEIDIFQETYIEECKDEDNTSKVVRFDFDEGDWGLFMGNGVQWMTLLPEKLDEIYFSYRLRLKEGFDPVLSGKFPGLYGFPDWGFGPPPEDAGFATKLSWTYDCNGSPMVDAYYYDHTIGGQYGEAYCTGCLLETLETRWVTFTQRIVMNSFTNGSPNADGILEVFADSVLVLSVDTRMWRESEDVGLDRIHFAVFFGGGDDQFAASRDEWVKLDDFIAFTYKEGVNVPRGNTPSAKGRKIIIPSLSSSSIVIIPPDTPEEQQNPQTPYIAVTAYGTEAADTNAHFRLFVNNSQVGETYVTSDNQDYIFNLAGNPGSDDTITIYFDNDFFDYDLGDRNLYIESINVNGSVYYPDSKNVVFLYDGDVLDGMDISYGSNRLGYPGKLIFYLGQEEVVLAEVYPEERKEDVQEDVTEDDVNHPPTINNQEIIVRSPVNSNYVIGEIQASDIDQNQTLTFSIKSGNNQNIFSLDNNTGNLVFNNTMKVSDTSIYQLTVSVIDNGSGPMSSEAGIKVTLLPSLPVVYIDPSNINDNFRDGTEAHPFSSWSEVEWNTDYAYLQKKGTISSEGKINIYAEDVVIGAYGEGELPIIMSSAKDYAFRAFEKSNITIKDIHIIANEAVSCIYFMGSNSDNNIVDNCILEGANNGVRIVDGLSYTIKYTTIKGTNDAIYSFAADNKIYYNIFKENMTAINISSYMSTADIYNNVFYGNSNGITTTYAQLTLYNNIFYLVNQGDLAINHSMDKLVSDNNIFYPEQQGFININNVQYSSIAQLQSDLNIDINSFSQDPEFIDIYNDNFMVNEQSPAIDAGKYVGLNLDFYGQSVPYGNQPDIGLTELQNKSTVTALPGAFSDRQEEPTIYPNPCTGRFSIFFGNDINSNADLVLTDMTGKIVFQSRLNAYGSSVADVDISQIPKGIYLVHLNTDIKVFTQQIIVR